MAQRLLTPDDLQKHPELLQRGLSANQHFDMDIYEQQQQGNSTPPTTPIPPQFATTKDDKSDSKKLAPKKATNGNGKGKK